jgi:hypothetical protein
MPEHAPRHTPARHTPANEADEADETARVDALCLQTMALRYAAGELDEVESVDFESRLAEDQQAREALSEAVRLSAAALGQSPPAPHRSFRAVIRERLEGWRPAWLARRAYRGHPLAWTAIGAAAVAGCTILGLTLVEDTPPPRGPAAIESASSHPSPGVSLAPRPRPTETATLEAAPPPREAATVAIAATTAEPSHSRSVAEIWADLSTPDHVEKTHDEELRWRHRMRDHGLHHAARPGAAGIAGDSREP